jgi:hypothetical protein
VACAVGLVGAARPGSSSTTHAATHTRARLTRGEFPHRGMWVGRFPHFRSSYTRGAGSFRSFSPLRPRSSPPGTRRRRRARRHVPPGRAQPRRAGLRRPHCCHCTVQHAGRPGGGRHTLETRRPVRTCADRLPSHAYAVPRRRYTTHGGVYLCT